MCDDEIVSPASVINLFLTSTNGDRFVKYDKEDDEVYSRATVDFVVFVVLSSSGREGGSARRHRS